MAEKKKKKLLRRIMILFSRLILGLVALLVLIAVLIQLPGVQTWLAGQATNYISSRTGTEMSIDRVAIGLPAKLGISGIYAGDHKGDTLLYVRNIDMDIRLLALARSRISIGSVEVGGARFSMLRQEPDTLFNLDVLLNSLTGGGEGSKEKDAEENENGGGSSWTFDIGRIELRESSVRFADHFSGLELDVQLGIFSAGISKLLPEENTFLLGKTEIGRGHISFVQKKGSREPDPPDGEPGTMPVVGLENLDITDVYFYYGGDEGKLADTYIGQLNIRPRVIDLEGMELDMEYIRADAVDASFGQTELSDISLDIGDLFASADSISLNIRSLKGKQEQGAEVRSMSAIIQAGKNLSIEGLHLETRESLVKASFLGSIPLLDAAMPLLDPGYRISAAINEVMLGRDIASLLPDLQQLFPVAESPAIRLSGGFSGTLGNLDLDSVAAEAPGVFKLSVTGGHISGLPDAADLFLDLPSVSLRGNPAGMLSYVPGGPYDEGLSLPDRIELLVFYSGGIDDFEASTIIETPDLALRGDFTYREGVDDLPLWTAYAGLQGSKPLSVLGMDTLLRDLSLRIDSRGRGFDPQVMDLDMELIVDSVLFNGYYYRDAVITAGAGDGLMDVSISYDDDNLKFKADNSIRLDADHPFLEFLWELDHLNAFELNFTDELVALQTSLRGYGELKENDFPVGELEVGRTNVLLDREVFTLDSLVVVTAIEDGIYSGDIVSPILRAAYRGNLSPARLPASMSTHFSAYIEEEPSDTLPDAAFFDLKLDVFPSPYFFELLIPAIDSFEPFSVEARFDSDSSLLLADLLIPDISVSGWHLQNIMVRADSDPGSMELSLHLPSLESDQLVLGDINLKAHIVDRVAGFELSFNDHDDIPWLGLPGTIEFSDGYTGISLDEEIILNRQKWNVLPGNNLVFTADNIIARDFVISSGHKQLALLSTDPSDPNSPVEVRLAGIDFGEFDLLGGTEYVGGVFDATAILEDIYGDVSFIADLEVERFAFRGDAIGDIEMNLASPAPGSYSIDAGISGYGNRLTLAGDYIQDEDYMDLELRLANLELSTLEALTSEQLTGLQGNISGNLALRGSPSDPVIEGRIDFNALEFHIVYLNTSYSVVEESIVFDANNITFDDFTLLDQSGRPAALDGRLAVNSPSDIGFDLRLSSDNFLLMDIEMGANEILYGRLLIDTDLGITGDISGPVIEGSLKLNQGSSIAVIPPQTMPQAIGDEGVVEFISVRDELFADLILRPDEPSQFNAGTENLDVSLNLEIDPLTRVLVIIDQVAGDQLEIRGGGVLSFGIDPGGRMSLAGRYEISQGAYQMTFYEVVRRNFSIERGSNILWTGDPMDARLDITARHTVRTSARELMTTHASSASQQETAFRQLYPFDVYLNMRGELMSPDISFEISLPPEHRGALDGRLEARVNELNQNESELNKQVFALLIIGNFIQDDPLAAVTAGPGLSSTARTSASRILSQQLNRLSDRYIRGVDISFELESYEGVEDGRAVGRTELQMEVSRDFFDQRLRITAGGHVELEDETRRQLDPSDIAGDFSVEYLLDQAGRYTLRGYRERRYQDVFDGELVESGISLIFRQTFNQFREIFIKREDEIQTPDE